MSVNEAKPEQAESIYADGSYLSQNPDWHSADSGWKARQIDGILTDNRVPYETCAEVGCGAGKILVDLAASHPQKKFVGFETSPDAAALWPAQRADNLAYRLDNLLLLDEHYDLVLLIDVMEHVPDYMGFLTALSRRARYFVFHIPLELTVSALLRDRQLYSRAKVGHLHYFSRATALATLEDTGYRIKDWRFTHLAEGTVEGHRGLITSLANIGRRGVAAVSTDLASKLLGGYSLLVLAEARD